MNWTGEQTQNVVEDVDADVAGCEMQPVVFQGMLGWLHLPLGRLSPTGVLLAPALGREANCAYMPMRLFADELASAGFPTFRFDFRGAGDSLDDDDDDGADATLGWLGQIQAATAELKARAGVERVVIGGLRMGAALAAVSEELADGLMLLAPVLNGHAWLRQVRFSDELGEVRMLPEPGDRALETGGYRFSPETVTALGQIDLFKTQPPHGPVFVAAQNRLVAAYAKCLAEGGVDVRVTDFPGFQQLFPDPATNLPPTIVFHRAVEWMVETFGAAPGQSPVPARVVGDPVLKPLGATERVVTFGNGLRGVLCLPDQPAIGVPAVLFCSTGGDPRAGVGRFAAQAARAIGAQGVASLRFDFAGLGDSDAGDNGERGHVYETPRAADVAAAISFLAEQGLGEVACVGVCSGAYHALHSAWSMPSVVGVFAVSPIKIVWRPGDTLTFGGGRYRRPIRDYLVSALDLDAWGDTLRKGVNPAQFFVVLASRLGSRVLGLAGRQATSSPRAKTQRFLERGGRAAFVMSPHDGSVEELETHFGPKGRDLVAAPGACVRILTGLDHSLARRASRRMAIAELEQWLDGWRAGEAVKIRSS